jgi:hypothetical protein
MNLETFLVEDQLQLGVSSSSIPVSSAAFILPFYPSQFQFTQHGLSAMSCSKYRFSFSGFKEQYFVRLNFSSHFLSSLYPSFLSSVSFFFPLSLTHQMSNSQLALKTQN